MEGKMEGEPPTKKKRAEEPLSDAFLQFMRYNNIPQDAYDLAEVSRFVRVNMRRPISASELQDQVGETPVVPIAWIPNFFKLKREVSVAGLKAYKQAQIYGIDVSSGVVVHALGCQPYDNVLDLCCAPGSKMCMIADLMGHKGSVTGVDVSIERLSTCKTLIRKYFDMQTSKDYCPTRLFHTDGSIFSVLAPSSIDRPDLKVIDHLAAPPVVSSPELPHLINATFMSTSTTLSATQELLCEGINSELLEGDLESNGELISNLLASDFPLVNREAQDGKQQQPTTKAKKKKISKKKRGKERDLPDLYYSNNFPIRIRESGSQHLYDRVLVDAECTLDASVRHLLLHGKTSPIITESTLARLNQLQCRLIENGFRLLREGGTLVYSTCSFCVSQNEDIVRHLIRTQPTAQIVQIDPPVTGEPVPWSPGDVEHTIRFYPKASGTSGMFIAKVTKLPQTTV